MSEEKPKTTRTRRTKAAPKPAEGLFVGGVYVRRGADAVVVATLECCVANAEWVGVSLVNPLGFNEKFRIAVDEASAGVPGWTYVSGGVALEDALKAGA